jgi:Tol biopolymer transport system component
MKTFSCVFVILCLLSIPTSSSSQAQRTSLVSVNFAGTNSGNDESYFPTVSADGRYIAFTSVANDLVPNDQNNQPDVFVRDLQTGVTSLVSINLAHTASGNGGSSSPSISADGRFIAFDSDASNLTSNPVTPLTANVYVRDRVTGITTLVSIDKTGTKGGNHNSLTAVISADGRVVAYASVATDLVPNDTNGHLDVFARNLQTGITTLVSVNNAGTNGGNSDSSAQQGEGVTASLLSADGRFVTFISHASDLVVTPDTNDSTDIFVRDLIAGKTTLASINAGGTATSNGASAAMAMNSDGSVVAFSSNARDIVANANGGVFVRNLKTQTTVVASINSNGGSQTALLPALSADGRYVTFMGATSDLVPGSHPTHLFDIFVRDLKNGVTTLVSMNRSGTGPGNGETLTPTISSDGRYVAFISSATDLVDIPDSWPPNISQGRDVFVRDLQTGQTSMVSINQLGTEAGNFSSPTAQVSANGRTVMFSSAAGNLVATDTNNTDDIFAYELSRASLFDTCIQDDSSGSLLQINTATGAYQFTNCGSLTVSGTGSISRKGGLVTLQQISGDRRVMAKLDISTNKANATVQLLSQGLTFSITDRNITNNTCTCR